MRKRFFVLTAAVVALAPAAASAQGFAVAGRVGTLGLGAEAALGLSPKFQVRGGLGLMPLEPTVTIDDIEFTLGLPETWFNIGGDLFLGSGFRIGAGMMFKPDDPTLTGELTSTATVDIGDETYTSTEVSTLNGTVDSKDQAPYVLIGFGRHAAPGVGLFLDLGVAFVGEPEVILSAEGRPEVVNSAEFQAELRKQEQRTEDDFGSYIKYWPIINFGVKIGFGG